MDRKKVFVCAVFAALVVSFAFAASAQDEETTEQVDWADAAYYAELMDTWVNDNGIEMNTYYDDAQNLLWSMPSSLKVEAAAEAFAVGPEHAGTLLITQWIVPTSLWLCIEDEGDDPTCADGYKWGTGDFGLYEVVDKTAVYHALDTGCGYDNIERVYASGTSGPTNYCPNSFKGYYRDSYWWFTADDFWCNYWLYTYRYYLDDSVNIDDFYYDTYGSVRVARFRFVVDSSYYYTEIWLASCIQ